ncbi:type II toxin-antitoxin system RelE family toxin [Campylobacter sp. 7477a]|uniref:type II toxin-antitoxin system RelE family toxin n=1 Tax=Campylobacter sp. 7477a TaxID=2735741 RepID=UPI003015701B|nr:type II toxin-antitoxin system RelE/ParE family toxin [Campylobacter sp. 7477a]
MKLEISDIAKENLKKFNKKDYTKIKEKLIYLCDNYEIIKDSKNITSLVNFSNFYRYRISSDIMAVFQIKDDKITILILKIGHRKDIYK